jgi:hypothetical protein
MVAEAQAIRNVSGHADVLAALKSASQATGSDFNYLLSTAMRESGLDYEAKSASSSASGLFQFVDQTWFGLVKRFGDRYGLGRYADAIQDCGNGRYTVAPGADKAAILALRQNPQVAALMAGESTNATKQSLECALGRPVGDGELYAAHFLGEGGARQLIQAKDRDASTPADSLFPQAAKANRAVFYHPDGSPKSVGEVYAWLTRDSAPAACSADAQIATAETARAGRSGPVSDSHRQVLIAHRATSGSTALMPANGQPSRDWKLPQPPLLLTPGLLEILAAFAPPLIAHAAR